MIVLGAFVGLWSAAASSKCVELHGCLLLLVGVYVYVYERLYVCVSSYGLRAKMASGFR